MNLLRIEISYTLFETCIPNLTYQGQVYATLYLYVTVSIRERSNNIS